MARLTDRPPGPRQPGSPPGSPFLPPQQRPPLPPAPRPPPHPPPRPPPAPGIRQRALAAVILAILGLIPLMFIGNLQRAATVAGVALGVSVVAAVVGFSAVSAAKRSRTQRPRGALAGAVIGLIGV